MKILQEKILIILVFASFCSISFSQSLSEKDIKQLAKKTNKELQGMDIGNGTSVRGCYAVGRKLIYQYNVKENWYAPVDIKKDLISNFKEAGYSKIFFNNDIDLEFHYYFGNKLRKRIYIKSIEFSNLNFGLGDYISIKGHPKAKGVNLKLRKPKGWELKEGDRPNIVKKFMYETNSYMILVKNNITFFSRNEVRELFSDKEYVNELILEYISFAKKTELLDHRIITVDRYPTLEFTWTGQMNRSGIKFSMISKNWIIFYEDKIVNLHCSSLKNKEFKNLENLYNLITNSVIFPEQYNY